MTDERRRIRLLYSARSAIIGFTRVARSAHAITLTLAAPAPFAIS